MIASAQEPLTKPVNPFPVHFKKQIRDDLTTIKGIGPACQHWLREVHHVQTFADLAGLSVDEIEAQLKAMGQVVSRRRIHHWLMDAKQLAAVKSPVQLHPGSFFRIHTAPKPAQLQPTDNTGQQGTWRPFASFVVELQTHTDEQLAGEKRTKVHHIETDSCATWPGIVSEQLCQWMMAQLGDELRSSLQLESTRLAAPPTATPMPKSSLREHPVPLPLPLPDPLKMTHIQVLQPPGAGKIFTIGEVNQPFSVFVQGGMPFRLAVTLETNNLVGVNLPTQFVVFHLQAQLYNLSTGSTRSLSEVTADLPLDNDAGTTAILPTATLSPGVYRLQLRAILESTPPIIVRATVPLLHVM